MRDSIILRNFVRINLVGVSKFLTVIGQFMQICGNFLHFEPISSLNFRVSSNLIMKESAWRYIATNYCFHAGIQVTFPEVFHIPVDAIGRNFLLYLHFNCDFITVSLDPESIICLTFK